MSVINILIVKKFVMLENLRKDNKKKLFLYRKKEKELQKSV